MDKKLKKLLIVLSAVLGAALIVLIAYRIYIGVIVPQNGVECGVSKDEQSGNVVLDVSPDQLAQKTIVPGCSAELRFNPGYAFVEIPVLSGDYMNPQTDYLRISDGKAIFQSTKENDLYKAFDCKPDTRAVITTVSKDKYSDVEKAGSAFKTTKSDSCATHFDNPTLKFKIRTSFNDNETPQNNELKLDLLNQLNINSFNIKNRAVTDKVIGAIFTICDQSPESVLVVSGQDYDNSSLFCALLESVGGATYDQIENNYRVTYAEAYGLDPYCEEISAFVANRLDDFLHQFSKTPNYTDLKTLDYGYVAEQWLRSHGVESADIYKIQNAFYATTHPGVV